MDKNRSDDKKKRDKKILLLLLLLLLLMFLSLFVFFRVFKNPRKSLPSTNTQPSGFMDNDASGATTDESFTNALHYDENNTNTNNGGSSGGSSGNTNNANQTPTGGTSGQNSQPTTNGATNTQTGKKSTTTTQPDQEEPANPNNINVAPPTNSHEPTVITKTLKVYATSATSNPLDTGIDFEYDNILEIDAVGTWNIGTNPYYPSWTNNPSSEWGPNGVPPYAGPDISFPTIDSNGNSIAYKGGLAVSIGTINGAYITVGSHFKLSLPMSGRLYLFCEDEDTTPTDNSGYLTVTVKVTRP
ncbi:MAG: hypothetical protein PHS95_01680 [Candidatus Pacebacteria bacterium]|nr:hypothetical protein [Candidatus Paceibacterota bacterium]